MDSLHILLIMAQVPSRSLVHMVSHLNVVSRTESKHMPVEMKFYL